MGTITISGNYQQMLQIDSPSTTVNLAKNGAILSTSLGIMISPTAVNSTVNVDGYISAPSGAVYCIAAGTTVNISASAELVSTIGVFLAGDDSSATNRGTITATSGYGLYDASGRGNELRNDGDIFAVLGMSGVGDGGKIINGSGAEIHAFSLGMNVSAAAGEHYTIVNHGNYDDGTDQLHLEQWVAIKPVRSQEQPCHQSGRRPADQGHPQR